MKTKIYVTLLLAFGGILFSSFLCKKYAIKLIDASSQNWVSGIQSGGSGTEYYFKIKILTEQKIDFDSLWVKNESFKTYLANKGNGISGKPITFSKNDTITLRASDLSKKNNTTLKTPINYKGVALLRYFVKNKEYYLSIEKIKTIPSINRP